MRTGEAGTTLTFLRHDLTTKHGNPSAVSPTDVLPQRFLHEVSVDGDTPSAIHSIGRDE
jgi:hypothetical protein